MGTGAAFVVSGVSEKFSSLLFRFPRKIFILCISNKQRGREHWAVLVIPKVLYLRFIICWLNNFGDFHRILIGWLSNRVSKTFQSQIVIEIMANFVYHHWGSTTIYQPLSYLFRTLSNITM